MSDTKAICLPSGEKLGDPHERICAIATTARSSAVAASKVSSGVGAGDAVSAAGAPDAPRASSDRAAAPAAGVDTDPPQPAAMKRTL